MADYKDVFATNEWPLAKFYFRVEFLDGPIEVQGSFQGVEGLESEISVMEYRMGDSPLFFKSKRYGMMTYSNVTLKKGMFAGDMYLKDWWNEYSWNHSDRSNRHEILITLMDENDADMMTWTLKGCFPVKFTPSALDAEADSEIALEELELACESWSLEFAG
ncbi:MAG: phage tail protein [Aureispira sp.]|nr:phage tail protein [Aureispira sp.]